VESSELEPDEGRGTSREEVWSGADDVEDVEEVEEDEVEGELELLTGAEEEELDEVEWE
jgi:hypothetical protein